MEGILLLSPEDATPNRLSYYPEVRYKILSLSDLGFGDAEIR
jgi:hypothetical protein